MKYLVALFATALTLATASPTNTDYQHLASSQKDKISCGDTEMRREDCPEWLRGVVS